MKIGRQVNGEDVPAFEREGYQVQEFANGVRCLLVRSSTDPIGLLVHLLGKARGPVAFLYVLLLSRRGRNPQGRHESPYVSVSEAIDFLRRFGDFLSGDGRHELWIHCPDEFEIVYDHHERIWIYGDLELLESWATEAGIPPEPLEPIPVPHSHHYHAEFDDEEDAVMAYWEWRTTPLRERDGE